MRYIVYIIMVGVLSLAYARGQEQLWGKGLLKPNSFQFSPRMGERASKLKELFDQEKWKDFYLSSRQLFNEINNMNRDTISAEDFNDFMWCFYLVCKAPFYEIGYTPGFHGKDDDIFAKSGVASFLASFRLENVSKITGIKPKFIKRLNSLYFSTIVKSFYSQHELNLKIERAIKKDYKKSNGIEVDNYFILERRDNVFHNRLFSFLELQLVEMLIQYFPDNSREVFKYIKISGYEDSEISELIDRAVGLNSSTKYLYQGRIGQEHRKRIKMHLKHKTEK